MIIKGQRGSGKTSELIYQSHKTGATIVVQSKQQAKTIYKMAKEKGIEIPSPVSVNEMHNLKGKGIDNILVDEFDKILEDLLGGYKIRAMTTSETVVKL